MRLRSGSSPLTRGKHEVSQAEANPERLIPAHAGKTCRCVLRPSRVQAHPRSRGENAALQAALNNGGGSSPLTRGKLYRDGSLVPVVGLIPAHAGKTTWQTKTP